MFGDTKKFTFGSVYCPYVKSSDLDTKYWETDFQNMQKLNFNTVRSFVFWARIERREGNLNFEKLDYLFELAAKYNMKVLLNLNTFNGYGGIYPPRWLKKYDCQTVIHDPCQPERNFGPMIDICMDDPVFIEKYERFMTAVIKRYAEKENLQGWNLSNEPFIRGGACYCKHTLSLFRKWLKINYNNDIEQLNTNWGTEFPVDYQSWDEIEPEINFNSWIGGGIAAKFDWYRFNEDNLTEKIRHLNKMVKVNDPKKHLTTTNLAVQNAMHNYTNHHKFCDLWGINSVVDVASYSHYCFETDLGEYGRAARLARIRSSSQAPHNDFLVLETEAESYTGVADREKSLWQVISQGAKSLMIWKYRGRVSDTQMTLTNLVGWDGSITERAEKIGDFSASLQKNAEVINGSHYKAKVAILISKSSMHMTTFDSLHQLWEDSWMGAYKMLWEMNIPADFVSFEDIVKGKLEEYEALLMPYSVTMTPEPATMIKQFASEGGYVIADFFAGLYDEYGKIQLQSPGFGLEKLFGCKYNDRVFPEKGQKIKFTDNSEIEVYKHLLTLQPQQGCDVIAYTGNEQAAAISNDFGEGRAIFIGTGFFAEYRNNPSSSNKEILEKTLGMANISCDFEITDVNSSSNAKNIELSTLYDKDNKPLIFVINNNYEDIEIQIKSSQQLDCTAVEELIKGETIDVKNNSFIIKLLAQKTKLLKPKR